jgi:Pretoxin HINT domain
MSLNSHSTQMLNPMSKKRFIAFLAALYLLLSLITPWANAQPASPAPGGGSGGIKTICPNPGVCFKNKEAKDNWAKDNKCQFLEDVCEKTPANQDDKGSKPEDAGFWSGLWNNVAGAVKYGYEFGKGLFTGLKEQVTDIIDLISDPLAVAEGLVTLGKAFYDDPKGTLAALAELLGQEAVDTITKATACGAYDLGKVIGTYVSPAVALKLAAKLAKFTGKIADAVKATKLDLGCASFIAGTPIHTPQGMSLIERITAGSLVDSRDESRWNDKPQAVSSTFGRTAPSFRQLQTELETLSLTDEHPLWVQGKGWTQAKDVVPDDILATLKGDVLVRTNTVVAKAVQVYNFSVANTPNYFVGEAGVWAHNAKGAKCNLTNTKDIMDSNVKLLDPAQKGFYGEVKVVNELNGNGYTSIQAVDPKKVGAFDSWKGTTGIDGIFKDKNGKYVIVESKTTGAEGPKDLCGKTDKLCTLTGGERQMSNAWISERIKGLPDPDRTLIENQMKDGTLTRVYARTDGNGNTTYNTIGSKDPTKNKDPGDITAEIGSVWIPQKQI